MALTQETILTFLLEHGGKVKNSELLNNFKSKINCSDPAEKQHNRDLFKGIVNSVAVVKQIDDVKFVVVKRRYQDFVKGGMHVDAQKSDLDDSFSSRNTSFSPTCSERSIRRESAKMLYSDIENNNMQYSSNINGNYFSDNTKHIPARSDLGGYSSGQRGMHLSSNINSGDTTVKVLNISDPTVKAGKTGAVFAVIAVKSPPLSSKDSVLVRQDGFDSKVPQQKSPEMPNMLVPKVPSPSEPAMDNFCLGSDQGARASPWSRPTSKRVEELQAPSSPQLRKTQHKSRQGDDANKYSESFPLEPMAHEWLVKSAAGLWGQIYGLLLRDAHLAKKKDFTSGFTALHWAAKGGNSEMVRKIMNVSKKRGTCVDVNSKSHGGYTPLHIAAIHCHDEVMFLLVQGYGAKVNVRDNDGKKPYHYLDKGVSDKVRELLGCPQLSQQERTEDEDYRESLPKGLNTISRLFQPHIGHRKKQRHQQPGISFSGED